MTHKSWPLVVLFALATLVSLALWRQPVLRHPLVLISLCRQTSAATLPIPVRGITPRQLVDTFGAPRAGHRHHKGIDIFASRGTPVLSTTPGIVARVDQSHLGGHVVGVLGPGLRVHYYAHLDRFGDFTAGDIVQVGDLLGFVGDSGNAPGTPCHLHYEVRELLIGAINPYPSLAPGYAHKGSHR